MTDREWIFPDKLQCFNPAGTKFEEVFKNPVALIAYAQYRRKHIVSDVQNEWLPRFALEFAKRVAQKKQEDKQINKQELSLEEVFKIWTKIWNTGYLHGLDENDQKWKAMLEPVLPFLNGKKILILVKERVPIDAKGNWEDQWFLKAEKKETT